MGYAAASWIEDFLSARTQEVVIEGSKSTPSPVSSGVPQETVLGPLLFLTYINDMPECVRSEIKLFADDSLLYRRMQNNADRCQPQEDLDKLQGWEQKWQVAFNAEKCKVIRITNKKRPLCSDYFIHNQKLALRTEAKYLGVTIGSDLSWSRHADNITKKANSTMGFLKRNIRSAPQAAKETAYNLRPSSDQLWSMPLQPGHHSQILKPARLRWSSEGQRDLCQMTTDAPAVSQR